jgi:hypothetical protein
VTCDKFPFQLYYVEFYERCRKLRGALRECLRDYRMEDAYREALKGIHQGLTELLGDMGIRDKIRDITKLNKDFAELRKILEESPGEEEARQGFRKLKKRFRRKAKEGEKSSNYSRLVRQMRLWEGGLFHCYVDERIPRTNNDMEEVVKRLRRGWKRTTGLVNMDEYLLYHAPYAVYLLNYWMGYLVELGLKADPYAAIREVPKDRYQAALKEIKERKNLDIFRKKANKDIDTALKHIIKLNKELGGSSF